MQEMAHNGSRGRLELIVLEFLLWRKTEVKIFPATCKVTENSKVARVLYSFLSMFVLGNEATFVHVLV